MDTVGAGKGGTSWENYADVYTLSCVKHREWEATTHREPSPVLCDRASAGWDGVGTGELGWDILKADSCCCKAENSTTLLSNYSPVKEKDINDLKLNHFGH